MEGVEDVADEFLGEGGAAAAFADESAAHAFAAFEGAVIDFGVFAEVLAEVAGEVMGGAAEGVEFLGGVLDNGGEEFLFGFEVSEEGDFVAAGFFGDGAGCCGVDALFAENGAGGLDDAEAGAGDGFTTQRAFFANDGHKEKKASNRLHAR